MKGLFVRIPKNLDQKLTQFCKRSGYKKTALLTKLIEDFLARQMVQADPIRNAQAFGIDISLLEENLKNSPTERLKEHQQFHKAMETIRKTRQKGL